MKAGLIWRPTGSGFPGDQERDLMNARYYAEIGPDDATKRGPWSWSILEYGDGGGNPITSGPAMSEDDAKRAVVQWELSHMPVVPPS